MLHDAADRLSRRLMEEDRSDWVLLARVLDLASQTLGLEENRMREPQVQEVALSAVKQLVAQGQAAIGTYSNGPGFQRWPLTVDETGQRLRTGLETKNDTEFEDFVMRTMVDIVLPPSGGA